MARYVSAYTGTQIDGVIENGVEGKEDANSAAVSGNTTLNGTGGVLVHTASGDVVYNAISNAPASGESKSVTLRIIHSGGPHAISSTISGLTLPASGATASGYDLYEILMIGHSSGVYYHAFLVESA